MTRKQMFLQVAFIIVMVLGVSGCRYTEGPGTDPVSIPIREVQLSGGEESEPFNLVSTDSMLETITDLTNIQPYSGWRNSASQGEAEAQDYMETKLGEFEYLASLGLSTERETFRVFNSTEIWETRLHITRDGEEIEVPADTMRGKRHDNSLAIRFDSDGTLNDSDHDPVVVDGEVILVHSYGDVQKLEREDTAGKVIFLDYSGIDRFALGQDEQDFPLAADLLAMEPAGIVVVTEYSDKLHESHGTFVGDSNQFTDLPVTQEAPRVPILYVTLENLQAAGVKNWNQVNKLDSARLTWDVDVFSPGTSGNLVARIPGKNPGQAVILGAHIDSPNSPGGLDDGSGSAILLEIARVLDASETQPPVDVYLCWWGSEEIGLIGAGYFAENHQELLDRTIAMLQIDMLSDPLDDLDAYLLLPGWTYGKLGIDQHTWGAYLQEKLAGLGVELHPYTSFYIESDNHNFTGFDVPNADLIYMSEEMHNYGPVHYATHIHDPYDTVEQVAAQADVLEQMAITALAAALYTGEDQPGLRVAPEPTHRVLFIASHTEEPRMTPTGFTDFAQALAMQGFDVDMVPYGQTFTTEDLAGTELVIALPVHDYTGEGSDAYDEDWTPEEVELLTDYVAEGGTLVITNSAKRLSFYGRMFEANEDWGDGNTLAGAFGVSYQEGMFDDELVFVEDIDHPLVERVNSLELFKGNTGSFEMEPGGTVLAQLDGHTVIGLVPYGENGGSVLVLGDIGLLGTNGGELQNRPLWDNIARFALGE